jgi:hypothetical protein
MLSFNARVTLAMSRVLADYPDAIMIEAEGKASAGLIEHPSAIDRLRVVFRCGDALLVIEETGYGEFGAPPVAIDARCSDTQLRWPVEMDLPEADRLKEQFGYIDPYARVALRIPQGIAWANASFVFGGNPRCPEVIVDTVTGTVRAGA